MRSMTTAWCSIALCAGLAMVCPTAPAQTDGVMRAPRAGSGSAEAKPPVPTRDTIRPLTKAGAYIAGKPETPGSTKVSHYCHQYDQAMKSMIPAANAYSDKRGACIARAFTACSGNTTFTTRSESRNRTRRKPTSLKMN